MLAKRGFVPEDERSFSPEDVERMRIASGHVFYLINEGYDLKQANAFVGNHVQLAERQRLAVTRSLATREQLAAREKKRIEPGSLSGCKLWIDGFNTVIALEVMLCESILFRGMDGCIRDLASLRGTYLIFVDKQHCGMAMDSRLALTRCVFVCYAEAE